MHEYSLNSLSMEYGRVSIIAIHSDLFWKQAAGSLIDIMDGFVIRLNVDSSDCPDVKEIKSFFGDKLIDIIISSNPKDGFTWREEMLKPLHAIHPKIVVTTDSDERVPFLFGQELDYFEQSDKKMLMMSAEMETIDGREVPQYPSMPHCRAFKWTPEVSYIPYSGYAYPNPYGWLPDLMYNSEMKYGHYAFYTKELEKEKTQHAIKKYGSL